MIWSGRYIMQFLPAGLIACRMRPGVSLESIPEDQLVVLTIIANTIDTYCRAKALLQTKQLNGFSLVCDLRCLARCSAFLNACAHTGHTRSSLEVLRRRRACVPTSGGDRDLALVLWNMAAHSS